MADDLPLASLAAPAVAVALTGREWRTDGSRAAVERAAPEETAVAISYDGRPHTVLMATPADLDDLARGFTVTEAIASADQIENVALEVVADGVLADVRLSPGARRKPARPRTLEGRSSCGLCGVQRLQDAIRPLPAAPEGCTFRPEAVQAATAALSAEQTLGRLTRATHAAAFADAEGRLRLVREDVGRHNALDKLAGGLLARRIDAAQGFVVVTSRCSFEMVEKAVRLGAPMIVAVSAPTALAISRAEASGLTLVALARDDGHTVFSRPDRLAS
ncbi:formate dehydrogenase accessory sulfurtransferase FdhD [Phenylobacterium sp. J367]|uniref:formate dehydrogenase accessory sulfurtransferase FdhD n=1 Tax=Phenylobacterium sp. J367 TaxID=2898435 RepID=UPI002151D547|nr:formate dehydrogenase accessory sulfurtransferase FdhD [Phenylobacterium sp. J367]MCR5879838.1 formate dehydrogenase accessory sulfurtransferase FdhD [Phenylobacterium sp. J367]